MDPVSVMNGYIGEIVGGLIREAASLKARCAALEAELAKRAPVSPQPEAAPEVPTEAVMNQRGNT